MGRYRLYTTRQKGTPTLPSVEFGKHRAKHSKPREEERRAADEERKGKEGPTWQCRATNKNPREYTPVVEIVGFFFWRNCMLDNRVPIIFDTPKQLPYIEVLVAADMHCGSNEFDERKWREFERLLDRENTYIIFAGDQMEMATRTSKSDVYTQTLRPAEQKRWWIDRLRGREDKIIAIVDGNHEFNRASKDADQFPLYDIAIMLGIEDRYRSEAAFVDIGVGTRRPGDGSQWRYVGYAVHKAQNQVNYGTADGLEGIDFFVSGHTHKPMDKPLGKLVYDTKLKAIREKSVENIVSGHFLRYGGYAQRGGMRPTSQKLYRLIFSGREKDIQTIGFHV